MPDSVQASELDPDVRRDLRGLQKETADVVARHLVAAGVLVDDDPGLALEHARYARKRASRIAVVREAAGIVAYHAGEWNEALGEFRAARRMGGGPGHVPVMADIERALGRPERALDLARSPEAADLSHEERVELLIVAAGARRDLGELEAAVVGLQVAELDAKRRDPWSARLFYAYADNLLAAGRAAEAVQWFVHAHDADTERQTDAADRIADLTGDELAGAADDGVSIGYEDAPAVAAVATDGGRPADDGDGEPAADSSDDRIDGEPDARTDADSADGGDAADGGDGDRADHAADAHGDGDTENRADRATDDPADRTTDDQAAAPASADGSVPEPDGTASPGDTDRTDTDPADTDPADTDPADTDPADTDDVAPSGTGGPEQR